jgi:cation diffusion facilitator family transporter
MTALTNPRIRATLISLFAGLGILTLKFIAFRMTGSAALKSDAYEGVVNITAAAFALVAILFAEQPTDQDHPYGHGKIENFSAAFEGGLISLAAILILYEGVNSWVRPEPLRRLDIGLLVNLASGLLNGALGWYLTLRGRALNSAALKADGHHVLSDFYTTLAVVGGVALVWLTDLRWLDSLIAIAMGAWLLRTGYLLVRSASNALLDLEDPETVRNIVQQINHERPDEIITLHGLRTLRSGRHTHVDVHMVIPEYLTVRDAHDLVEGFGVKVLKGIGLEGEFHSHMDPCSRAYCRCCVMPSCPIRMEPSQGRRSLTIEEAMVPEVGEVPT